MTADASTEGALQQQLNFRWDEVPSNPERRRFRDKDAEPLPPLGALEAFVGAFRGKGLNTIFRPHHGPAKPDEFPTPPVGPDDNVLEINPTEETLTFLQQLGRVPNRGMVQDDMFLNGVAYLQTISDPTLPPPNGIHLEPGVWLNIPATQAPAEGQTVVRMASIPHGTTIEAQGTSFTVPGGPQIADVDITPSFIGGGPQQFPSQTVTATDTFRIPQDLADLVNAGVVVDGVVDASGLLTNPNFLLQRRAKAQNITSTSVLEISTTPAAPLFGGGTDNIAFLLGDANAASPNANASEMTAVFWVETVADEITVPPTEAGQQVVVPGSAAAGDPVPTFSVTPANDVTAATTVPVTYIQIQYTQTVILDFNGLHWPHVSVATLVPDAPVVVTDSGL